MRKIIGLVIILILLLNVLPSQAANIHVRYFESADVVLTEAQFQLFSFSPLEGEQVTIVAYGLEEGMLPALSVLDVEGRTLIEDLNPRQIPVAAVEFIAPANGIYTFLVSRLNEVGGLMRVMLFVGEPLSGNYSLLDTIDPLLPSRAYLISGDSSDPVEMTVAVMPGAADSPLAQIYASRGTEIAAPPLEERINPIQQISWENAQGDIFYTLNVRALPDPVLTSQKVQGQFSQMAQFLDLVNIRVDVNDGIPDPDFLPRNICTGTIRSTTTLLAGPGGEYIDVGEIAGGTQIEIAGFSGDFFLIVDLLNPTGGSWVPRSSVELDAQLDSADCARVQNVIPPTLTDLNRNPNPPGGTGGGGGNTAFGNLPPGGEPPPDAPGEDEQNNVFNPPPQPPGAPDAPPGTFSLTCDSDYGIIINYANVTPGEIIAGTVTGDIYPDGPFSFAATGAAGSEPPYGYSCAYGYITVTVNGVGLNIYCDACGE